MSLFVAVRPSDEATEDLEDVISRLRRLPQAADLRWQPAWQWHVTVAFLGDPPDDADAGVIERLDRLESEPPLAGLRLAGSGCFGRQIVWVGLEEGGALARLATLASSIPRLLRGSGVTIDRRPWRPHLTVARARRGDGRPAADLLADYSSPPWSTDELLLIRSTGGPRPEHRVVHRVALSG